MNIITIRCRDFNFRLQNKLEKILFLLFGLKLSPNLKYYKNENLITTLKYKFYIQYSIFVSKNIKAFIFSITINTPSKYKIRLTKYVLYDWKPFSG